MNHPTLRTCKACGWQGADACPDCHKPFEYLVGQKLSDGLVVAPADTEKVPKTDKEKWVAWLMEYGPGNFYDTFLVVAQDAEAFCQYCGQQIYLDIVEGGGTPDWRTSDGDYGCSDNPISDAEGTGGHKPRKMQVSIRPGATMIVFDAQAWAGKDVGDNSQFWKPATIIDVTGTVLGDLVAEVEFEDGRRSKGHFVHMMRHPDGPAGERSTPRSGWTGS